MKSYPIPTLTPSNTQKISEIEDLVQQILDIRTGAPKADTTSLESQIDDLVYELYELTPEEIQIVKGEAINLLEK